MMKNNLEKLKSASNQYRLKEDSQITEKVLTYIEQRIEANRQEIEDLIELKKQNITYAQIDNAIKQEIQKEIKYKDYKQMRISNNKFISTSLLMPVGTVAVEAYDTIEVIRVFHKSHQNEKCHCHF